MIDVASQFSTNKHTKCTIQLTPMSVGSVSIIRKFDTHNNYQPTKLALTITLTLNIVKHPTIEPTMIMTYYAHGCQMK